MKKLLALALVAVLVFSLVSCGGKDATVSETPSVETEEKAPETGAKDYETVAVGNKIATDFIELTVTEAGMADNMQQSITTGYLTRTFGPEAVEESDYAYIKGTIMNKSTSSVQKEIMAIASVGDYTLEENEFYVYKSDGDTVWELSPLVEYNFMMCVEIPNALVGKPEGCDFKFGFKEGMESSFGEFDELDYKYSLHIAPEAAPAE